MSSLLSSVVRSVNKKEVFPRHLRDDGEIRDVRKTRSIGILIHHRIGRKGTFVSDSDFVSEHVSIKLTLTLGSLVLVSYPFLPFFGQVSTQYLYRG